MLNIQENGSSREHIRDRSQTCISPFALHMQMQLFKFVTWVRAMIRPPLNLHTS